MDRFSARFFSESLNAAANDIIEKIGLLERTDAIRAADKIMPLGLMEHFSELGDLYIGPYDAVTSLFAE